MANERVWDLATIEAFWNKVKNLVGSLKSKMVFSVNGEEPVNGDVTLLEVPLAMNLSSDKTQESLEEFIIRTSGGSASISDGDAFALRILGNRVHEGYVPESLSMDVAMAERVAPSEPIEATIDRDMFVSHVAQSGVITLTYTTVWSANPALYGVTVTGTPVSGDTITITYYKEERGTIKVATPTALKSTGWNLYNHAAGYAYLTKYSSQYGFRIGGAYTALQYSETLTGTKTTVTPVDGVFMIPDDGYVWVTGGNGTDTYIINQWSDWTEGPAGEFKAYSETVVDLSTVMSTYFPNGLLRVDMVRDEINLNASVAISKIDRMAYSAENLAAAKASGRAFEYDTNYIYIVKASYVTNAIVLDGSYTASDHGNEFFMGSEVPVYLETMYGNNLKNKLERDVVQISQQTLTNAQKEQVRSNLSAASQAAVDALNSKVGKLDYIDKSVTLAHSIGDVIESAVFSYITNPAYNYHTISGIVTWESRSSYFINFLSIPNRAIGTILNDTDMFYFLYDRNTGLSLKGIAIRT